MDIIKKIEQEQLKSDIAEFRVGDSVKVHTRGGRVFLFPPAGRDPREPSSIASWRAARDAGCSRA